MTWTVHVAGQEVKVQGHGRPNLCLEALGNIILDPLSRVDRRIQWATEMLPLKRGGGSGEGIIALHNVLTAPPVCRICVRRICFTTRICCSETSIDINALSFICQLFIARQHIDARYWYRNFVCPFVRPKRYGIWWKRLNILSQFFHRTVDQSF